MSQNTELAIIEDSAIQSRTNRPRGLELRTLDDYYQFAGIALTSGLAPKGMSTVEAVVIALCSGSELGLSPMQSLQNIGVINGKPAPFGDALPAIVQGSGLCELFDEWFEENGEEVTDIPYLRISDFPDSFTAVTVVRRKGRTRERVSRFSVADAKRAGLWAKAGPWSTYPQRMLRARAMTFAVRDEFPDVTKGFVSYEELRDVPVAETPEPARAASRPAAKQAEVVAVAEVVDESGLDVFGLLDENIDGLSERYAEIERLGGKNSDHAAEFRALHAEIKVRIANGEKRTPKPKAEVEAAPVEKVTPVRAKAIEAAQSTEEEAAEAEEIFGDKSGDVAAEAETPAPAPAAKPAPVFEPIQDKQKQAIHARARKLFGKEDYEKKLAADIASNMDYDLGDGETLTLDEFSVRQASDLLINLQTRITEKDAAKEAAVTE